MSRFLVFAWSVYYPVGGESDCIGAYETQEDANAAIERLNAEGAHDCAQILDAATATWQPPMTLPNSWLAKDEASE